MFGLILFAASQLTTLHFLETVQDKTTSFEWTIDTKERSLDLTGKEPDQTTKVLATKSYKFLSMKVEGKEKSYTMERDGRILLIKSNKETIKYNLGKGNWVQTFWFGLRPLVDSDDKSYQFSIINPDDFSLHKMVAIKDGTETINLKGKEYEALRIKISLKGFKGMFWSAKCWFDTKTHNFLKYIGNQGPNTPDTIITAQL